MSYVRFIWRMLLVAVLVVAAISCVKQKKDPEAPPESMGAAAPSPAGRIMAQAGTDKRYYKDNNGQLYYVDKDGALHTVYQSRVVEKDSGGGLYYVEGEARPAYRDPTGVLYYTDKNGKVLLMEDDAPGKPVDPMPILRGTDMERKVTKGMRQGECEKMLQDCLAGCASRATEAGRKACYDSCEQARAMCGKGN